MPRGVGKDFMDLLQGCQSTERTRVIVLFVVGLLLGGPAFFLWQPLGVVVHYGALLVGLSLGYLVGMRTSRRYEDSLRGTWNQWMRLAPACETVQELARKVRGGSGVGRTAWIAAFLTLLWAAELGLLVLAFMGTGAMAFSLPVIVANGLLVGLIAGYHIRLLSWTRAFRRSLDDMVQAGEIGVWGAVG